MAKPTYLQIISSNASWDGSLNTNTGVLEGPIPIVAYASAAALETAYPSASYDECIALVIETEGPTIYLSDGTSWNRVASKQSALVVSITDNSGGVVSDADEVPFVFDINSARDAVAVLSNKVNQLLTALKAAGAMSTT